MLESCGMSMGKDDLQEIIDEFDEDNNGTIDFEEFVQIFVQLVEGSAGPEEPSVGDSSVGNMYMESVPKLTESVEQELTERREPNQMSDDEPI